MYSLLSAFGVGFIVLIILLKSKIKGTGSDNFGFSVFWSCIVLTIAFLTLMFYFSSKQISTTTCVKVDPIVVGSNNQYIKSFHTVPNNVSSSAVSVNGKSQYIETFQTPTGVSFSVMTGKDGNYLLAEVKSDQTLIIEKDNEAPCLKTYEIQDKGYEKWMLGTNSVNIRYEIIVPKGTVDQANQPR